MKKILLLTFLLFLSILNLRAEEDLPSIFLPKVDIKIDDEKQLELDLKIEDSSLPEMSFDTLPKPDLSDTIKIDLETTLPQKIDSPEKQKPVNALITFGYGLNNYLFADFAIFIKEYNPKVSIRYLRESKETLWFDRENVQNAVSLDDLRAEMIYNYKIFNLGAELGYYAHSYALQEKSSYNSLTKRILNVDFGPSLKFNYQNDLTLRVLNSFFFSNSNGEINTNEVRRRDFDYILETDLVYTQVFGNNHFFTSHIGYDFNYLDSLVGGDDITLASAFNQHFFNSIKVGAGYSTILKDSFLLKASVDFIGMFRETTFYWYLLPIGKFGYSLQDFFHCYVEGGGKLIEKPDQFWYKENDFVVFPTDITPGTRWFAKTGVKGSVTGWFSLNTDFEFAYNQDGLDWEKTSESENLYTLSKYTYMELNLGAGLKFNVKEYFEVKVDWVHYFLERMHFNARDSIIASMKWAIPKTGLSFFVDFEGRLYRLDLDNEEMTNIYLMNAGIDWNWQEKIGLGAKFNNILYFQNHQIMPDYDDDGFDFLIYVKIGF